MNFPIAIRLFENSARVCLVMKLIKGKDGRNRGFAFVTMSTAEEAAAAVEKLNSHVSVFTVAFVCSLLFAPCCSFTSEHIFCQSSR